MSRILWRLFYRALLLKSVTIVYRESNTIKYYDTLSVQFWMALALKVGFIYYLGLTLCSITGYNFIPEKVFKISARCQVESY
jgi:hypothetical protein